MDDQIFAAVVGAVAGVLVGAALTWLLWIHQRNVEKKEKRRGVAGALLFELDSVTWVLRLLYNDAEAGIHGGHLPWRFFES